MINLIRNIRQFSQADSADAFASILGIALFSKIQSPPPPPPTPRYTPAFDAMPAGNTGIQTPIFHFQPPLNNGEGLGVYSPSYSQPFLAQQANPPYLDNAPFQAQYPLLDTSGQGPTFDVTQVDNGSEPNNGLSTEDAEALASDIADGKSIDQVAEDYGISREEVLAQLESDGLEVEKTKSDDGRERTVEISDPESGDTVAKHELTEQQDGVVVEEITDADGETTTTVINEQGRRTELKPEQDTTRAGINDIVEGVADGQSIEEIAEAQGLSPEQVIAQIEAAGYEYETGTEGEGPAITSTTHITAEEDGEEIVSHETGPSGTTTSVVTDAEGNETRRTENNDGSTTQTVTERDGRKTTTTEYTDGSSTKTVTETDGRETTIAEDADGNKTTTVTYEQNGVTVEEVTGDDGKTTTTIIDEDNNRTALDDSQNITREGIDDIVAAVANGKSIEEIAEQNDLTQAQVEAQLRAAGYVVETSSGQQTNGLERYTTKIVSTDDPGEVIASHSSAAGTTPETSLRVDSNGTETRTTEYNDGRSYETVTRKDGRETSTDVDADGKTTTSITDNGYTLTTHPDGDLTLRRDEDGTEIDLEQGTPEAALADTLMEINPDSEDGAEARAAEVVQTAIEGMMAGERIEDLQSSVDDKTEALNQAIEDYGPGVKPENNVTTEDPYGDPPTEDPPSGGTWVPMNGVWMDSAVARATLELNELVSEQLEASAEFKASQAQLDVYARDSDYDGALDRAQQILDEALAPHGLVWVSPEEPSGSLADAQERLDDAEAMVEQAGNASTEFADAQDLLDRATSASKNVPDITVQGVCTADDTPDDLKLMRDQYEREQSERNAALTNVDSLFYDMGLHFAKGNNFMADYSVGFHEQQLAEAEPGSKQHKQLTKALEEAQQQQEISNSQVNVAQAYSNYHHALRDQAQLQSDAYDIRDDLLKAFNEDKGLNEEGKEFSRVSGDYLGEFTGKQVIEEREDGLWVTTHFEHGTTEEQLAPEEMSEFWEKNRDPEVTANWLDHLENRQGAHEQVSNADSALSNALNQDFGIRQENLADTISELEAERKKLFKTHDEGTTEAPEDAFPDGSEPQNIGTKQQPVLVTQDVKDTFDDKGLLAALNSSDQPVGIKIDGETRWVHPDIAITTIALEAAKADDQAIDDIREGLTQASDRSTLMAEQPAQRMGESDMDFENRLELGALEDDSDEALDTLFQPRFQQLAEQGKNDEQGYDNTFVTYKNDELEPMLDERFGLNRNNDDSSEALDEVLESIHDTGGDDPQINIVPMFHVDEENGVSQVNLIAVQGDDDEVRYVDMSGKHYSDLEDFRDNNQMFSDDGKLVAPRDLDMSSEDGKFDLEVVDAHETSALDSVVDPLVGIGTGIATVLSFTPAAPVAAPLAFAGGAYLGGRAVFNQIDHVNHGGDWNDTESWLNYGSVATTAFPLFSSGLRAIGMARTFNAANSSVQMTRGQAVLASIGGVKPGSNVAEAATTFMSSKTALNRFARFFDWAAIATGVPLMGYSAKSLITDGSQMSGLQLTDAIVGLTTGFAGTGLGTYGLWTTRPSRNNGTDTTTSSNTLQLHDVDGSVIDARILGNPPESTEHVYLQPEIGPRPRGDEAGVSNKTHILHRDPQTGEAYVTPWIRGASEPSRSQSPPAFVYRLDSRDPSTVFQDGFTPRFGEWTRKYSDFKEAVISHLWADDSVFVSTSRELQMAKGAGEEGEWIYIIVDPRTGTDVDALLGSSHEWAGSSEVLYDAIPSENIIGARQLSGTKEFRNRSSQGEEGDNPTWANTFSGEFVRNPYFDRSLWTSSEGRNADTTSSSNTLQLHDADGNVIDARILGNPPESAEHVYLQPEIGPRPRGDEAGVSNKTHILYRDPQTGEDYILPWIRGASEAPGTQSVHTQQTSTPPEGMPRLYRLGDLDALNQASQDGSLPPGQFVHIVRSSNPGIDNGNLVIAGGTVPKSGRVNDDGHIVWPSTRPEDSVRLSLESGSNGQQQLHITNTSGDATPRALNVGNDTHFIVLSTERVRDFRALVQGGGLPFALHDNGQWTLAANQATTVPPQASEATQTTPVVHPTNAENAPAATQATAESGSGTSHGEITLSQDGQGTVVHLPGVVADRFSVSGQSKRRFTPSPYDRHANKDAVPDSVLLPRSVLEQALSPEAAAQLPDGEHIRVSLVTDPEAPVQPATHQTADNSTSPARNRTATGLAAGTVLGSMGLVHSAASFGKPSELVQRPAQSETSSYADFVDPNNAPGLLFNGPGFIVRGILNAGKARFDEKLRLHNAAMDNGELNAQMLNWEASRIIASRRALNLNNEQVSQVTGLIEGLWGRYQLLDNLPVTPESQQRGWTEQAKKAAIQEEVNNYRSELANIAGDDALTVNPMEPRTWKGIAFNSSILTTHMINDAVSWHYLMNGGLLDSSYPLALQIVDKAGLAGFLAANVVLAGSAAVKLGTGLARVDLKSLPLVNKLTGTSTFLGSYLYGIMTPPWAALTLHSAATSLAEGNWVAGGTSLAALPFQIGLSYYGIKGLRDDAFNMTGTWDKNKKPYKAWPKAMTNWIYPIPSTLLAGLTATEAAMQSWHGDPLAGAALAGGTAMQLYFINLASRRLNWADVDIRHGPFRQLTDSNLLNADGNRIWKGVGLTLALSMVPGWINNWREWLGEDRLPDWEWLVGELDDEKDKESEAPATAENGSSPSNEPGDEATIQPGLEDDDPAANEDMAPPSPQPLEYIVGQGHRINPAFENHRDYYAIDVQPGQTSLGSIITGQGYHDVADVVAMNMEHIVDPTALRVGDRIYFPRKTA
ncbi:scabin-related ADP-ribosyltransferase [Halomonas binhaiensis]|uniref:DUF4781 domain-containing protein n=1 Tax=Halomonas binhaiensis TaxID=2562282 RepID=A0A5C1NH63_9GAMM|nr:DUF4781 domain-containing protein [Halomonas binhaiensis]QEM82564.1 DUF4781 domain-containing protein [Halomonas binhaiensis]